MEIEIFTLCDFAQDNNSKLTIVGTFDSINSKQFPLVHSGCAIACRIRFSQKEKGRHDFKLRLIDASGKELINTIEGSIDIPETNTAPVSSINLVAQFAQLKLDKPGRYSFELYIDDEWKSGLPLFLNKIA
jgi:hypothetical protein